MVDLYDDKLERHMHTPFGLVKLKKQKRRRGKTEATIILELRSTSSDTTTLEMS